MGPDLGFSLFDSTTILIWINIDKLDFFNIMKTRFQGFKILWSSFFTDIVKPLKKEKEEVTPGSGSTYVRWGRTSCHENGTETVYTGYAAGGLYTDSGAAANTLCLPTKPLWGEYDDGSNTAARIYGAEYEIFRSYSNRFFKKNVGEGDVPCAVCRSIRTSLLMIPGRNACYDGWSVEYTGYLSAGYYSHYAASEYVCLDADPDVIAGSQRDHNGKLFYMTEAKCGSLPCPPYVEGRELTCVVCSL